MSPITSLIKYERSRILNDFYEFLTISFSHELLTPVNQFTNLLALLRTHIKEGPGMKLLDVVQISSKFLAFFI